MTYVISKVESNQKILIYLELRENSNTGIFSDGVTTCKTKRNLMTTQKLESREVNCMKFSNV